MCMGRTGFNNFQLICRSKFDKLFKHIGFNPVITIYKSYIISVTFFKSIISRDTRSAVNNMINFNSIVFQSVYITYSTAVVSRTVIDQNYFKICIRLINNGLYASLKIWLNIINRNNYRY